MGKRIGMARVEALLENLDREINMKSSQILSKTAVISSSAALTLNASSSGAVVLLGPKQTVTLPTAAAGLTYKVICVEDIAGNASTVTTNGSGDFFAGSVHNLIGLNGDTLSHANGSSNDVITFGTNCDMGDYVEIVALNGTLWHVVGSCSGSASANGIKFSDS
tara:strand:- start:17 stop:508 length:492 start_codon:yes stop_codon:yes gene_type:complete